MPNIVSKPIPYVFGGTEMSGEFVIDREHAEPRPGVVIVHEAFGLGAHAIDRAERLARLGYAAFAMDLWGGRSQIGDMPTVMDAIGAITGDRADWMGRVGAALAVLAGQDGVDAERLAAIGYCFGGATVLEFARTGGALQGVASFHGALSPVGSEWAADRTAGKLLVCTGAEDPLVPASALEAFLDNVRRGGVDCEVDIYSGTKHSFTNVEADAAGMPEMIAYHAQSDRRSWVRLLDFLEEIFG